MQEIAYQYIWYHLTPLGPFALPTDSSVRLAAPLMINGMPSFPAAAAEASSPPAFTMVCTPMGARRIGEGRWTPNMVVYVEEMWACWVQTMETLIRTWTFRTVTLRSIRGVILQRSNSVRFATPVVPLPAQAHTYMKASSSRFQIGKVSGDERLQAA